MNDTLDAIPHHAEALLDRRRTMRAVAFAWLAAAATGLSDALAGKHKNKKRKRRKNNKQNNAPAPSCAELCSEEFAFCFERAADSTLCADRLSSDCSFPCSSDQDCLDVGFPFCVTVDGITDRATGEPEPFFCAGPAVCAELTLAPD